MEKQRSHDAYVEFLKSQTPPGVWGKGVRISREKFYSVSSQSPDPGSSEWVIRCAFPEDTLAFKVTLWPEEEDYYCEKKCSCKDKSTPCPAVVACALQVKNGLLTNESRSEEGNQIQFDFYDLAGKLGMRKIIATPSGDRVTRTDSLVKIIGASQTGKSTLPCQPSADEIQFDSLFQQISDGTSGIRQLTLRTVKAFFRLIRSNSVRISFDGKPISGSGVFLTKLIIDDLSLTTLTMPKGGSRFSNGFFISEDKLGFSSSALLSRSALSLIESSRQASISAVLTSLSDIVTSNEDEFEIQSADGLRHFEVLRIDPTLTLELSDIDSEYSMIRSHLYYGSWVKLNRDGALEADSLHHIPVRNRELESRLAQISRTQFKVDIGSTIKLSRPQAIERFHSIKKTLELYPNPNISLKGGEMPKVIESVDGEIQFSWDEAIGLVLHASGKEIDAKDALSSFRNYSKMVKSLDGSWVEFPTTPFLEVSDLVESVLKARAEFPEIEKNPVLYGDLNALFQKTSSHMPKILEKLNRELTDPKPIKVANVKEFTLRDYQLTGVSWLQTLKKIDAGALLADEMGLGKTLQICAVLEKNSLIVAPVSLLFHWEDQIKRTRPDLKVKLHHGSGRDYDFKNSVVLTSYSTLRIDLDRFLEVNWASIILDESQAIKNSQSLIARSVKRLKSSFRVCMTGTPIENSLDDLKSQFDFLIPGLISDFDHLQIKTKPFVLRRTKETVLSDLPDKTETIITVDLSEDERKKYDSLFVAARTQLSAELKSTGKVKPFGVLELILRLRQACIHPALVPGLAKDSDRNVPSSKTELLLDRLSELTSQGRKALVFSQWTSALDIIEKELDGISFPKERLRIDGSTKNRGDIVNRFQTDKDVALLLMTLKAGGVGLNLTAADHVFIFDPWWNPATEAQATDRVHRIGQVNPVFVYRLIAKDTIEERLLALQSQKREIAAAFLDEETLNKSEGFSLKDVEYLFDL